MADIIAEDMNKLSKDATSEESEEEVVVKKKTKKVKKKKKPAKESPSCCDNDEEVEYPEQLMKKKKKDEGIKTLPLMMLLMMTGTTLIPALLYASDYIGAWLSNQHIMGNVGHRLGIGPTPKKRVVSFYEKHDPSKLDQIDTLMAKHYGQYDKLVKRLERKYHDYGYFMDWKKDEQPLKLAKEQLLLTSEMIGEQFDAHAPRPVKNAYRNAKYNIMGLYKKGNKVWRKQIWPVLQPYVGVPDERTAREQKRKDARQAASGKPKRGVVWIHPVTGPMAAAWMRHCCPLQAS